ncbi:MAG: HDOD domain-containing protein [Thermodesulfobacteriota bacterium]
MQQQSFLEIAEEHLSSEKTVLPLFDKNTLLIHEEAAKPEPDHEVIVKRIISDQALTSQVLKTANSAFFLGLSKVSTVRGALIRLGTQEIANIVTLASHGRQFKTKDQTLGRFFPDLWHHSTGSALGAQWIARKCGFQDLLQQAFIGGLLHDVGKLFVLTVLGNIKAAGTIRFYPAEGLLMELMESLHTRLGCLLLQKWNLPEVYCQAARDHHEEETHPKDTLLMLVKLANTACNKKGLGPVHDPSLLLGATPEAHYLGLSEVILAELEIKLEDAFNL